MFSFAIYPRSNSSVVYPQCYIIIGFSIQFILMQTISYIAVCSLSSCELGVYVQFAFFLVRANRLCAICSVYSCEIVVYMPFVICLRAGKEHSLLVIWQMLDFWVSLRNVVCVSSGCEQFILMSGKEYYCLAILDYGWSLVEVKCSLCQLDRPQFILVWARSIIAVVCPHAGQEVIQGDLAHG